MEIRNVVKNIELQYLGLGHDAKNVRRYFINTFLKIKALSETTKAEFQNANTVSGRGVKVFSRKITALLNSGKRKLNDDLSRAYRNILNALDFNTRQCHQVISLYDTKSKDSPNHNELIEFISRLQYMRDNIADILFDSKYIDDSMRNIINDFTSGFLTSLRLLLRTLIKYEDDNGFDSDQTNRRLLVAEGPEFALLGLYGYAAKVPIQHYHEHIAPFIQLNNIFVMYNGMLTGYCFMPDMFLKLKIKLIPFRDINFNPSPHHHQLTILRRSSPMNELKKTEIYELYQATKQFHDTLDVHWYTKSKTWDRHVETLQHLMKKITPLITTLAPDNDDPSDIGNYTQAWEILQSYYATLKEMIFNHPEKCNASSKSATQRFDKTLLKSIKQQDIKIVHYKHRLATLEVDQKLRTISTKKHYKLEGHYEEAKIRILQLENERKVLCLEREASTDECEVMIEGLDNGDSTKSILNKLANHKKKNKAKLQSLQKQIQLQQPSPPAPKTPIINYPKNNGSSQLSTPRPNKMKLKDLTKSDFPSALMGSTSSKATNLL